jgi:hypothetical protein
MSRPRITKSKLIRSTNSTTNSKIVRRAKQQRKRIEKNRAVDISLHNAFGTKGRSIYIGT